MFPIIVTVVAGVQNIKPILLTSASMGASRWQIFRWVIFPHMIPSFFAGMRLGMTGVLLGVLLAELYVSTAGIGYFTTLFTQNFDPTKLLGLVAVLAAMAIALNEIVRRAEVHFARWRTGKIRGKARNGKAQADGGVRRLRDRARAQGGPCRPTASSSSCSPAWGRASATGGWRARSEFDVCEVNVGAYFMARDRGEPLTAIPVFLHRRFRHGFVFVNANAGIKSRRT